MLCRGGAVKKDEGKFVAVSCRVTVSFSDGAREARRLFGGALPYEPGGGGAAFDVLASEAAGRFTCLTPSSERLWTIVRRANTPASARWDPTQRILSEVNDEELTTIVLAHPSTVDLQICS